MKAYRTIAAVIAWAALVGQYWLMTKGQPPGEVLVRTVNFFSYFTILTNLLAALALTLPVLAPDSVGRWWGRPAVRGGITVCIAVVMVVYHLVLRGIWEPQGLQKVVDYTLHYVDPLLFILDWLLFAPKGTLRWRNAIGWLAFPAVFGIWTLGHGALSGFYPYPFMEVTALGYPAVLANMAAMVLGFLIPGLLLVGLDGLLGRSARQTA